MSYLHNADIFTSHVADILIWRIFKWWHACKQNKTKSC
jgi:hypothetical protein